MYLHSNLFYKTLFFLKKKKSCEDEENGKE
jgi:hypothetical protein